jgi:acetyl-CoA carboxylase/biotin carboxylase 1
MARLDPEYRSLRKQLADPTLSKELMAKVKERVTARERLLLPVYMQVSLQFADLHDRAGRMKAKNVIRKELQWKEARRFFYWRVRRRINEEYLMKHLATSNKNPLASRARNLETLAAWTGIPTFATSDREVATWYEANRKVVHEKIEALKTEGVSFDVASLLRSNGKGGLKGVQQVLSMMPAEEREAALKYLSQA